MMKMEQCLWRKIENKSGEIYYGTVLEHICWKISVLFMM